jgi:phosphoribosylformylglycinamidine cyclo-ligase
MSLYSKRGVSAQKEDVHQAIRDLDPGLFPNAFCKIYPDVLGGDRDWVNIMHADGAGTKSILAYLYWKETGEVNVWKGIAQDAIVMNLDDLLCVGITDNIIFSSTIDRNKNRIPGEVLKAIIEGSQEFFEQMSGYNVNITYMGGETADVGDLVRTIAVNGTMTARWPGNKLITNDRIARGDVIVGLASFGQSNYESKYNSGLASNGLTSARHDMLGSFYRETYPETYEPSLSSEVTYIGPYRFSDQVHHEHNGKPYTSTVGELLLSPTRTFAPFVRELLESAFEKVHGMIHCSGGGQTKCLKYLPQNLRIVKDKLFDPPVIFDLIQKASGADDREMYQVFNMGTRLEIYVEEEAATEIISMANSFGIEARVIGRVEAADKKELIIGNGNSMFRY